MGCQQSSPGALCNHVVPALGQAYLLRTHLVPAVTGECKCAWETTRLGRVYSTDFTATHIAAITSHGKPHK